ncbi:hypothetical protein COCON_G00068010 [Conger conger]|uniref:Ion transport domain-containing protein n=2 Tax=Conger conger TaxID=82655 RepID=A0A9Q1DSQ1_CONCO|nr:hypothetical protein COCON_G00068010 [Conger conger]
MRTLVSIISLFFFLMLAFTLGFYALMINQEKFGRLEISLMQTFVMMVGELNYQENFLNPYLKGKLPFPQLTFFILVWFVLLMPILLMNLLIGLAVGDIAEVQKNATLKRIAMQIELHTNLEEKLPYWFMKRVDQTKIIEYPNRKCRTRANFLHLCLASEEQSVVRTHLRTDANLLTPVEYELHKQKYRLKEMASVLEKQHNLLKLIIQKMEIHTEAEDEVDGPELFQCRFGKQLSKRSHWLPLVKAVVKKE